MPVYNSARYLGEAVESILAQTYEDFELIVVDDGSTDRSRKMAEEFSEKDERVSVIGTPHSGIVGALNAGLGEARGTLIARMDGDDVSLPERFAAQVDFLEANPECVCVGARGYFTDSDGNRVKRLDLKFTHDEITGELLRGNGGALIHPAIMMRRTAVEQIGGYRQEANFVEDLDLFLRLSEVGELRNLDAFLLEYRRHLGSVTAKKKADREATKAWVMADAYRVRGLPTADLENRTWSAGRRAIDEHLDWAVTSFEFGNRRVPLKHALRGLLLSPFERRSWTVLSYVMKRLMGIINPRDQK